MSGGKYKLHKRVKQFEKDHATEAYRVPGRLGVKIGGNTLIEVPNRKGYVYVRLRGDLSELIQAYNSIVANIYDLPVICVRSDIDQGKWYIEGRDISAYSNWGNSSYLPDHGAQHSFDPDTPGRDITWVWNRQFMPLNAVPNSGSVGANNLLIEEGVYYRNNTPQFFPATLTADILSSRPATDQAKMVLVYLDTANNTQLLAGSEFSANLTGTADAISNLPTFPADLSIPIAGVLLVSGTAILGWDNTYDLRPFFRDGSGTGSGTSGGGDMYKSTYDPDNDGKIAWGDVDDKPTYYPALHAATADYVISVDGEENLPAGFALQTNGGGTSTWVSGTSSGGDASTIEYTPGILSDWNNDIDPGHVADALDQIASRAKILEGVVPSHVHVYHEDHSIQCDGVEVTFETVHYFVAGTTLIWLNGLLQSSAVDYSEGTDLDRITFNVAPLENDRLVMAYELGVTPPPPPPEPGDLIPEGPYTTGSMDVRVMFTTHAHSTSSDGDLSPAALSAAMAAHGHTAIAITDHNNVTADPGGGLIYIRGNEITSSAGHLLSLGSSYDPASGINSQTALDAIAAAGGVSIFAHPKWSTGWTLVEMTTYTGSVGMEIYNMHVDTGASTNPVTYPGYDISDWDYMLSNVRKDIFAFAGDDFHYESAWKYYNVCRDVVFADGSTEADIIAAIKRGNFVADVSNYGIVPGVPVITADDVSLMCTGSTSIRFMGSGGLLQEDEGDTGLYTFVGNEDYVRIEAVGDYTEPFDSLSEYWEVFNGTWEISSGTLVQTVSSTSVFKINLRRFRGGDFEAQFDVYFPTSTRAAALMYHNVDNNRFYAIRLGTPSDTTSGWNHRLAFGKATNGTLTGPIGQYSIDIDFETWYTIKMEYIASSGTHRAKIWKRTGESEPADWQIDCVDTAWDHGAFGFRVNYAAGVAFDNLYINGFKTYYQPLAIGDWDRVE